MNRLAIFGLCVAATGVSTYLGSRLNRNDAIRGIQEAVDFEAQQYTAMGHGQTKRQFLTMRLNWFAITKGASMAIPAHRNEFMSELESAIHKACME